MPILTWPAKSLVPIEPAILSHHSITYPGGDGYPHGLPENHLYLGDNLKIMAALLPEYSGKIDLIYADPPFFTNKNFQTRIGRGEDSRNPSEWRLSTGYNDHWSDIDDYLNFLYPRLEMMYRLLSPTGSLYLHLDWHADAYARLLLDEIFGKDRLINQIAWLYHGPSPIRTAFNRKHDTIFIYSKSKKYTFNSDDIREPYNLNTVKTFASSAKAGFGKIPDLDRGKIPEDWWYFPVVARLHKERTGYPTQKPEAILERIIRASSKPGDLVADFFCGSGTAPLVACRLGRRFISSDITWRAIHTTRNRLVRGGSAPFNIWHTQPDGTPIRSFNLNVKLNGSTISLSTDKELDYWELDPDWDGSVFRSAAQIVRPVRKGNIPVSFDFPKFGGTVRIRAVSVDGELFDQVIYKNKN